MLSFCDGRHKVMSPEETTFSWAFQKDDMAPTSLSDTVHNKLKLRNDIVKIYSVIVTNTLTGGTATCKACPKGVNQDR